ncbi:MAG TPA: type II secretion system protein [Candidatus Saccharimonadales bacterium]|nr:type II secretion system protein [Candidatus Saccharimonadales bacterium]
MASLRKSSRGFTIIELLVVIGVLIILGVVVFATYSGIQAKERNSKRSEDIANIQQQLEFFFQNNGYYPSLADMNNPAWLTKNLKHLDKSWLTDPSNPSKSEKLVSKPTAKWYAYKVTDSSGKSCESNDTNCDLYVLTATYEGTVNGAHTVSMRNID